MVRSLCPFAVETTFPLSNFKTKHIFGNLMARVKFLKPFRTPQVPHIFFSTFFYRRRRRRFPKRAPEATKGGADGTAPPEGEGNPAEGECFESIS